MLVLRFNISIRKINILSPVKPITYLWLKILYLRRHMPTIQSRSAPAVLSECENEDLDVFVVATSLWPYAPDENITYVFS